MRDVLPRCSPLALRIRDYGKDTFKHRVLDETPKFIKKKLAGGENPGSQPAAEMTEIAIAAVLPKKAMST